MIKRAVAIAATLLILSSSAPARAASERRIAGADRYETASAVAHDRWTQTSDVYLARGDDPADALAGAYGSGLHIAPVLLTRRDVLPPTTRDALARIAPARVRILGGTRAVGEGVADELRAAGYEVIRHAGADRYETAAAVARSGGKAIVGTFSGKGPTAFIASGTSPFDALAAGPIAAGQLFPILLTKTDSLPQSTRDALDALGITNVIVLGGVGVVSQAVENQLASSGRSVRRIAGADRTDTATAVADLMVEIGYSPTRAALVSATTPADALGAGPWAAPDTPVLLCQSQSFCGAATHRWTGSHRLDEIVVIGGTSAVSDEAASAVAMGSPP